MLCFFCGQIREVCHICLSVFKGEKMKYIKQKILLFVLLFAMAMPVSVYAAGEGNIDNGGGGMGAGTGTNFWSSHDEGVRVTVVRASDGSVASKSIDLTNKQPNNIVVQFGKEIGRAHV